jgi:hypothetical protein
MQQFINGRLAISEHYKDGALNDGANGAPAIQKFDGAGKLIAAERYENGVFKKQFTADELLGFKSPDAAEEKSVPETSPGRTPPALKPPVNKFKPRP